MVFVSLVKRPTKAKILFNDNQVLIIFLLKFFKKKTINHQSIRFYIADDFGASRKSFVVCSAGWDGPKCDACFHGKYILFFQGFTKKRVKPLALN
jgi:hypothetical protein